MANEKLIGLSSNVKHPIGNFLLWFGNSWIILLSFSLKINENLELKKSYVFCLQLLLDWSAHILRARFRERVP